MVSIETVKLADRVDELTKKLATVAAERATMERDEIVRREKFAEAFAKKQGDVSAVETDLRRAGVARRALLDEVPRPLLLAADRAGVEAREQEAKIPVLRREALAAKALLERRQKEEVERLTTAERDALSGQLARADAALAVAAKKLRELEEARAKADAAVDAEVQRIRKAAVDPQKEKRAARVS